MTAPFLAAAGLSKTFVPAGHGLTGLDDVSLAPGRVPGRAARLVGPPLRKAAP